MVKILVIGLDGATWDLMRPWAEKGILPTFKKLRENGVYGDLESTIPPLTGPAWVSFATGKNPGKHGCYDFLLPRKSLNDMKPITTKDIHGKTFYEILEENGKKCIIINLPGSYPPRIKETVITSLLTQGDNCIFPPDLVNEIPELKDYRISYDASLLLSGKIEDYVNDVRKLEKTRFECAKKLFEKEWDFFFLLFSAPDMIQHHLHEELVSGTMDENSNAIEAYKEMDEYIGWFVNEAKNINILFMSDHGFRVYKKTFLINGWLRKEGYLEIEGTSEPTRAPHKVGEEHLKAMSKRINLRLPFFLSNPLRRITWLFPFYSRLRKILPIGILSNLQPKLSETIAYSMSHANSNFGAIYINDKERFLDGKIEVDDYETNRVEIINKLKRLKDPETGENVIKNVWKREDVYFGSQLNIAPDIVLILSKEYNTSSSLSISKPFADKIIKINEHALQGIFLAYGHDIKKGVEIQKAKICDLAPTILHIVGVPIPKDMDGRVLKEIFKEDSELAKKEIEYREVGEKEMIKEKIKELRYPGKIGRSDKKAGDF